MDFNFVVGNLLFSRSSFKVKPVVHEGMKDINASSFQAPAPANFHGWCVLERKGISCSQSVTTQASLLCLLCEWELPSYGRRQGYACIARIPEIFDEKSQLIVIISGGSLRPKRSELKDVVVIVIVVGVVMVGGRFIVVR